MKPKSRVGGKICPEKRVTHHHHRRRRQPLPLPIYRGNNNPSHTDGGIPFTAVAVSKHAVTGCSDGAAASNGLARAENHFSHI